VLHAVIGQVTDTSTTTTTHYNTGIIIGAIIVQILIASLIAMLASRKGYSAIGFFLFGFFCWIPALIVALVISNKAGSSSKYRKMEPGGFGYSYGPTTSPVWQTTGTQTTAPLPPAGWYPDPGGTSQQRYWDGNVWTEHLH
jgi:hypothetical protein